MKARLHTRRRRRFVALPISAACLMAISSCADKEQPLLPPALRQPSHGAGPEASVIGQEAPTTKQTQPETASGPAVPSGRSMVEPLSSQPMPHLTGDKISITFDGVNLPAFVNTVFGDLLKVSFEIDPGVAQKDILVTLRTVEPITRDAFLEMVVDVLHNYGIGVVYQNNVFRIVDAGTVKQDIPRIIRSRAVPNVPDDMRPNFAFVPLHNVQVASMAPWLDLAFKDRIRVQPVGTINSILIMGKRDDIKAAIETIDVLDQPVMAGNRSVKISPQFWSAQKLADQLVLVLNAEGYSSGVGPDNALAIRFIPIPALNQVIAFSSSEQTMRHVMEWVTQLDQPGQVVNSQNTYYYQVQNTAAKDLAETLSRVLSGSGGPELASAGSSQQQSQSSQMASANMQGNLPTPPLSTALNRHLAVDEAHNAIIFNGTAEEYSQFRDLALRMDRAPLEVLVEATIAEVTLTEGENLGVTLNYDDSLAPAPNVSAVKSDAGLLVSLVRDRGRFLGNLTANANKNKVFILSSPRVIASSGKKANIRVGTQVPILTTQQQSPGTTVGGTSTILQDVQYHDTGVLLTINPTINSNRRVQLDISQTVSEAQNNTLTTVQSPAIFTRDIQTTLSLNDGETVLLGGLMSDNISKGNNGVPYLKDIPVLGNLFRTSSTGRTRIELIVLITPYIIDGSEAADAVRDAFRAQLTQLPPLAPASSTPDKH